MKKSVQNSNDPIPTREVVAAMTVEDLLSRWPQTAVIFHEHRMACVGCAVAGFFTIGEAADVYRLPEEQLVDELLTAIRQSA